MGIHLKNKKDEDTNGDVNPAGDRNIKEPQEFYYILESRLRLTQRLVPGRRQNRERVRRRVGDGVWVCVYGCVKGGNGETKKNSDHLLFTYPEN